MCRRTTAAEQAAVQQHAAGLLHHVHESKHVDGSSPLTFYQPPVPLDRGGWSGTPGCPTDISGNPLGGTLMNWRDVKAFGVVVPAEGHWNEPFRPAPPPALTSNEYAKDYNEVRAKGAAASCDDIDDARIYGGMHFRFDQVAGVRLGRQVATYVYKNNLQRSSGSN